MRNFLYAAIGIMVIFFAARDGLQYWRAFATQDATPTPTPTPTPLAIIRTPEPIVNNNIIVAAPAVGSTIAPPFTVVGSARVFENTVAITIKDAETEGVVYENFTTAQSPDTGQFGPYTHTVTYLNGAPMSDRVLLNVFWHSPKDGEPLDVVSIPLAFDKSRTRSVKVFFSNAQLDPGASCTKVFGVERLIAKAASPVPTTVELLLKGPSTSEREAGYSTQIPHGITLPRIAVAQGTATVDFNKDIEEGVAGSCRVQAIRAQVEQTLYQFGNISGAVLSVEGRIDDALQP